MEGFKPNSIEFIILDDYRSSTHCAWNYRVIGEIFEQFSLEVENMHISTVGVLSSK